MTEAKAICLTMIVKDGAETIGRCIDSAIPAIDSLCVVDTGSSDDTREIVRGYLDDLPGALHVRDWSGFGPNRTEALQLARAHCDYVLMLDADHRVHIDGPRPELSADSYLLRIRGTGQLAWRLPLLTRADHPFEYRGAAHCYLASDEPTRAEDLDWLTIDGGPGPSREKLEGDRRLLEKAWLEDADDRRTVFYLAQTYRDLGLVDQAIRFYRLRSEMGGWAEEVYYARFQLGVLLGEHVSFHVGAPELLRAFRDRPQRIEALRALANLANSVADKAALPADTLFVSPSAYKTQEAAA